LGVIIERPKEAACFLNILDRKLPEDLLRIPSTPGKRNKSGVVII